MNLYNPYNPNAISDRIKNILDSINISNELNYMVALYYPTTIRMKTLSTHLNTKNVQVYKIYTLELKQIFNFTEVFTDYPYSLEYFGWNFYRLLNTSKRLSGMYAIEIPEDPDYIYVSIDANYLEYEKMKKI